MNTDAIFYMLFVVIIALQITCLVSLRKRVSEQENSYYTDYYHKNIILRIYKPEFEYQAIGKVPREKLLDGGTFSQFYMWALIEK